MDFLIYKMHITEMSILIYKYHFIGTVCLLNYMYTCWNQVSVFLKGKRFIDKPFIMTCIWRIHGSKPYNFGWSLVYNISVFCFSHFYLEGVGGWSEPNETNFIWKKLSHFETIPYPHKKYLIQWIWCFCFCQYNLLDRHILVKQLMTDFNLF